MEPVPVTRRVRRTVRMAVALVVGQAMLCALIGWLTLGKSRPEPVRSPGSAVVDQLAAPPPPAGVKPVPPSARVAVIPTTRSRKPSSPSVRPAPRKTATAPRTTASPTRTAAPATRAPVPITAPSDDPAQIAPEPAPPPTSTPPGEVRQPVKIGDECRPVGAYGRTAEGELVRCVREWRHRPRWKIV